MSDWKVKDVCNDTAGRLQAYAFKHLKSGKAAGGGGHCISTAFQRGDHLSPHAQN